MASGWYNSGLRDVADRTIDLVADTGATKGMADLELAGAASADLEVANHVISLLIEGQVALPPTKLPVRAV